MRQAMLPESLEESTLEDLMNGETVWVVPWAMWADKQGFLWLNRDYTFNCQPGGTVQMKVSKKDGEYICDISNCRTETWGRGSDWTNGLPVSEVKGMS